jgi:hypothetical protein
MKVKITSLLSIGDACMTVSERNVSRDLARCCFTVKSIASVEI